MNDRERIWESGSVEETRRIAGEIAQDAQPGDVYALTGELGAGKTAFAGGFAAGLHVPYPEDVVSPTYTILQIHEGGRLPLYHFDVYRLTDPEEADAIGIDEYLFGDGVCLIEWASRIRELLPPRTREVIFERRPERGEDCRRITLRQGGPA